mmetsp:Transcript_1901/g.3927  ORF Transcript_1901/g.3927 Transcript_1901/m.3927 type:complete len:202 (-) Transcript_1901:380-985(-)
MELVSRFGLRRRRGFSPAFAKLRARRPDLGPHGLQLGSELGHLRSAHVRLEPVHAPLELGDVPLLLGSPALVHGGHLRGEELRGEDAAEARAGRRRGRRRPGLVRRPHPGDASLGRRPVQVGRSYLFPKQLQVGRDESRLAVGLSVPVLVGAVHLVDLRTVQLVDLRTQIADQRLKRHRLGGFPDRVRPHSAAMSEAGQLE